MSALTIIGRTLSPKGVIKAVYLAEHGYAPYTGALLYHYYNTPERAKKLVDAGHWQCLNKYLPEDIGVNENQKSLLNSARLNLWGLTLNFYGVLFGLRCPTIPL